jgi:hypothetical protein
MEKVMGRETELKLALAANGWRRFLRQPLLATALAAPRTCRRCAASISTPRISSCAGDVSRCGCAAPVSRWLQTVKCASVASGGLSTRPEWEQPFTGRFDFSMIEDRSAAPTARTIA